MPYQINADPVIRVLRFWVAFKVRSGVAYLFICLFIYWARIKMNIRDNGVA